MIEVPNKVLLEDNETDVLVSMICNKQESDELEVVLDNPSLLKA